MKLFPALLILAFLTSRPAPSQAAELTLTAPLDYQVIQRTSRERGTIHLAGSLEGSGAKGALIETRLRTGEKETAWQELRSGVGAGMFEGTLEAPAGGWYRLEIRALAEGVLIAETAVDHVGIGEVFVIAGQSNSANYGEVKQQPETGRVVAFDGRKWQIAADPQPGAGGNGGSFLPPLGDAVVNQFEVPVGFIACGIGATSVREWLPKGAAFPNPPTIESRVEKLPGGGWISRGDAFAMLVTRMKQAGPQGFRAVLWHQGESDANQKDPTRTLAGPLYREYLEKVIRDSRREIGREVPWVVALASYHVPGDEASPEIRAAQASLWRDGIAHEGPDSDALKGDLRERDGQGVHFSGKGLLGHAAKWAGKVIPLIERELMSAADSDDGYRPGASRPR